MQSHVNQGGTKSPCYSNRISIGSKIAYNQNGRLLLRMGSEGIILSLVFRMFGLILNIIAYSRSDTKDTTTTILNEGCRLTDDQRRVLFTTIGNMPSDGYF